MKKAIPTAALRTTLTAALTVLLSAAASSAIAQDAPPPGPPGHGQPPRFDAMPPRGAGFAAVNDLEQLRRLYAMTGRESEIIAVYHDVLNKTQDPMLRHYVYDSLAREQLKPANPDQAIATLRTSLAEDIAAANRAPHGDHPDDHPAADAPPPPQPQ
ncbi:hypothetical protein [Paraburkholderia phenazinium]|jgi:hypothetical protein|uniref:Uncharacterized protein n=1 Tax=Paraburkholderia phenazinium TaxID=60549 RepID=A0A1G7RKE2_9BURK|nr:hypothetical protein [Paraburkholderia phenazinium]SDG11208.1 hypothetical protein SAMN05216466_102145 [Paraburkholderia phenazinium]